MILQKKPLLFMIKLFQIIDQEIFEIGEKMRVNCAYCSIIISCRDREYNEDGSEKISHGICPACYEEQKKELDELRKTIKSKGEIKCNK